MSERLRWLKELRREHTSALVEGLVPVAGYDKTGRPPEEVAIMEKAAYYQANAVFFEASRNGGKQVAQAFVYVSDDEPVDSPEFAERHQRLWSWGGVPLIYRKTLGVIQLFRCGHGPDFVDKESDKPLCQPFKILQPAVEISDDPWWDSEQIRNGTLWDDPSVCSQLLSANVSAHKSLVRAFKKLNKELNHQGILPKKLRRKLLILTLLVAYLEERKVLLPSDFRRFYDSAECFSDVMPNGEALVALLGHLEERFNGNVFTLAEEDREVLRSSTRLEVFARLVRGNEEAGGQLTLWKLYSFKDLPVELISEVYQLFVSDADTSVYTPPFLVRLMLDEVLSAERLDRLTENDETILDPSCGSGVFLVEAFKRLVLHWRSRNDWKRPSVSILRKLIYRVVGVDLEEGAVELAAFSLCLALCDALEPEEIRASVKLFPPMSGKNLHTSCFFKAKHEGILNRSVGIILGNPPFTSTLTTEGARASYEKYCEENGALPDKQLAYLFLHEAMHMLAPGGVCCLLQQYNLLYNQQSSSFRKCFLRKWNVREILDFISVRGLFQKGGADTKVLVLVAEAADPDPNRSILHATFRRTGRIEAERGFDIDYYDLHWIPQSVVASDDSVWRCGLLGGGRLQTFLHRMNRFRTVAQFTEEMGWEVGEGFIFGNPNDSRPASHVVGSPFVDAEALPNGNISEERITKAPNRPMQWPRRSEIYDPPLLLIRKHEDVQFGLWKKSRLTYPHTVLGISAAKGQKQKLAQFADWMIRENRTLQALVALKGTSSLVSKATAILSGDILELPYPQEEAIDISQNERILIDDIVDYYRDLVRLGDDSVALRMSASGSIDSFTKVFCGQLNGTYSSLQPLAPCKWPGVVCQPFAFGGGDVDWSGVDALKARLNSLLVEKKNSSLSVTRIARIYDGRFIFVLKPDRLRFWLRSVALRDADETLADLRAQGF